MAVADRVITCKNQDGKEVVFKEDFTEPFILMSTTGIYTVENNVSMSDNTMIDGATYQGSVAKKRNIVLHIKDMYEFYDHRNKLNEVFKKGEKGRLVISDDGIEKAIDYYVESINGDKIRWDVHYHTISLLCPNPFFTTKNPSHVYIAEWIPCFEWVHEFKDEKEPFGYRSLVRMRTIENVDAVDNVGMNIRITCTGAVTNPTLVVIERNQRIKLGTDEDPFVLVPGDILEITTGKGDKHVYLTHNLVREEKNYLMTEDSTYIQLQRGTNSIGYDAKEGAEYMVIRITYALQYARA